MAGSFWHLVNESDGRFNVDLIENMEDAHEVLVDCFVLIHELSNGDLDRVENAEHHAEGVAACKFEHKNGAPADRKQSARGKFDHEIDAAQLLVEKLEPLQHVGRLRVLGAVAFLLGHYGLASDTLVQIGNEERGEP